MSETTATPANSQPVERDVQTVHIVRERSIQASLDDVFEALLEELGPEGQMPDGTPFPMKIEAWPGGRWYRDLGNNAGHLLGHVQVIKPPKLLEISGPTFMSYPAINFIQYRLTDEGKRTKLAFLHRAMGLIPADDRENMQMGWDHWIQRITDRAHRKAQSH